MYETRLHKLQQLTGAAGLDAVVLVPGSHLIYLTGASFHLMERPVLCIVPAHGTVTFIMPEMEAGKVQGRTLFPLQVFTYNDTTGHEGAMAEGLKTAGLDGQRVGVEGLRMRFAEAQLLARYAPDARIVDAGEALAVLRIHKDSAEVAALRDAIAISQDALAKVTAGVQAGMSEKDIANALLIDMLQRGGGELPFEPLVQTGPNSALPHGGPSDRVLNEGEILLIDFGTSAGGYVSDITRTFVLGELTNQRLIDAYAAVKGANEAGRKAAGPGVPCQEVDRAARGVIEKAGFGEYFIHRTGHGLGMEAHEGPYMREGNTQLLEPGHVFTVEPGIYLPGVGGIRIEDDVLVTADGAESLTTYPRELTSLGG